MLLVEGAVVTSAPHHPASFLVYTLPKKPPLFLWRRPEETARFCRRGRALNECDRRGHHPSLPQPSDDGREGYDDHSEGEGSGFWQRQAPPPPLPPSPSENDNLLLKVFLIDIHKS